MGTLNEDLDNIKAIEDKLTANKVANFAYTDHAYNNPLTEADGVTNYNVNNEQNIPVADPSIMNINETVLTKGWRSQASAITRMLMNHFLGRVSYNLNKLNDNMSALLTTLRANLSNVVNTGDSANVSSGGTTKFTTGGAYNLLSSIAPYFSTSTSYAVGDLITYQNKLYECTTAHSAGAWNAGHFTARNIQYVINNYILPSFAPAFSASTAYAVGDFVIYQNKLYRCTVAHNGAWNSSDFTLVTVGGELTLKADKASLALPTDAVLHYSFDEVPDFPDGVAVYKRDNDWVDNDNWNSDYGNTTFSVSNGIAKWTVTNGSTIQLSKVIQNSADKIIKMRIKCSKEGIVFRVMGNENSTYKSLATVTTIGTWQDIVCYKPSTYNMQIVLIAQNNEENTSLEISQFYVGDGSYSTPIIDNANGQRNSVSQRGVAVQGVSGKGFNIPALSSCAVKANFTLSPPYTHSLWLYIKPFSTSQYAIDGRKSNNDTNTDEGIVITPDGGIETGSNNGGLARVTANVISPNVWQHIAISCENINGGNKYTFYKNGVKIKEQSTTAVNIGFGELTVGARYYESQVVIDAKVEKTIDDLLIFDRALTEDEVMALYLNRANTPKYYGEVPVTRKVNGYTLEKDITLTKADMGLGDVANKDLSNVVNTGDSATPVSGGTTKFTTGGAYTELNKKFDKTSAGDQVTYSLSGNTLTITSK